MALRERVEQRLATLMGRVRERIGSRAGDLHRGLGSAPVWMVIRVIEGFDEDYEVERWLMAASAGEVRTVLGGYEQLLDALDMDDPGAETDARRLLDLPLPQACALLVRRWYEMNLYQPPDEGGEHLPGKYR